MHSYFHHPKDRLIILRLDGIPDMADCEEILSQRDEALSWVQTGGMT